MIKLGQVALIIFMIFAIVSILFMISTCCTNFINITGNKKRETEVHPQPFTLGTLVRM